MLYVHAALGMCVYVNLIKYILEVKGHMCLLHIIYIHSIGILPCARLKINSELPWLLNLMVAYL